MPRDVQKEKIRRFLLRTIPELPSGVARLAADRFGVTRQYANQLLRELVDEGQVRAEGQTRARSYTLKSVVKRRAYPLDGELEEHRVWVDFAKPTLEGVDRPAMEICAHGLTEIVNNAIDHSRGTGVVVGVERNAIQVQLQVQDDGVGIFKKIQHALGLEDEEHAVLELVKGKLTTDPESHTGEGIFFTSRMFDRFVIRSGRLAYFHFADGDWLLEKRQRVNGTRISMTTNPETRRSVRRIFDQFAGEDEDYTFSVTHVPVALAQHGEENLVSRSQAKRLLTRLDAFKRVVLNFQGVERIGQAFADEVFRVYLRQHPEIEIQHVGANAEVNRMIRRAKAA